MDEDLGTELRKYNVGNGKFVFAHPDFDKESLKKILDRRRKEESELGHQREKDLWIHKGSGIWDIKKKQFMHKLK